MGKFVSAHGILNFFLFPLFPEQITRRTYLFTYYLDLFKTLSLPYSYVTSFVNNDMLLLNCKGHERERRYSNPHSPDYSDRVKSTQLQRSLIVKNRWKISYCFGVKEKEWQN